ncbi:MAG: HEAT repeat domain-containing protein [Nitrospiraceae bacterium]
MEQTLTAKPPRASPETGGKAPLDPEVESTKRLLTHLEKSFKTSRTYGPTSETSQKFIKQLYDHLTAHLAQYQTLILIVRRFQLQLRGEVVYQNPEARENLAFKLFADGIRELTLREGLSQEELLFFLETLGGDYDSPASDDDIATRLWQKNLPSISFVTAEDIIKSSEAAALTPDEDPESLDSLLAIFNELRAAAGHGAGGEATPLPKYKPSLPTDLSGYEVSQEEMKVLEEEWHTESTRDSFSYVRDMLVAILASEGTGSVSSMGLFQLFGKILESLLEKGNWKLCHMVLEQLQELERRPDLPEEQRTKLASVYQGLGKPEHIKAIQKVLTSPQGRTEGLLPFLLKFTPAAVPPLITLLGELQNPKHCAAICEALVTLAKDSLELLFKKIHDPRVVLVRNLLSVIAKIGNARGAESLGHLARHHDTTVRMEAVRVYGTLCPSGNGSPLAGFVNDTEPSVRLAALKPLARGSYQVPYRVWEPIVQNPEFLNRPLSEIQTTFQIMSQATGNDCVPFWEELVAQRFWFNRKKQEAGTLAAEMLGKVGTPEAITALEIGKKRASRAVRKACAEALARRRGSQGP